MPSSLRAGMATSARQVVGLQDPPRNTSTGSLVAFFFFLVSSTLLNDLVLLSSVPWLSGFLELYAGDELVAAGD